MVDVPVLQFRAAVRSEAVIRDQYLRRSRPLVVAGQRDSEKAQSAWRTDSQDSADVVVAAHQPQRVVRVDVVRKLNVPVVRSEADAPRDALDVGVEWMKPVHGPL